jgi:hypothetical protein
MDPQWETRVGTGEKSTANASVASSSTRINVEKLRGTERITSKKTAVVLGIPAEANNGHSGKTGDHDDDKDKDGGGGHGLGTWGTTSQSITNSLSKPPRRLSRQLMSSSRP